MPSIDKHRARAFLALTLACWAPHIVAEPRQSLDGLWYETDNYPASSVMRFSRLGAGWVGRYVQVSPAQKRWGFSVSETVIRGSIDGNTFVGQVLLKHIDESPLCPDLTVGWVPIKMTIREDGNKLDGAWLQSSVGDDGCVIRDQWWQAYRLERLPAN